MEQVGIKEQIEGGRSGEKGHKDVGNKSPQQQLDDSS
jgi:hypothetical protein